jgi:ppGpp synthetase/RelA/SpoT-type nucleotidyltranferase
VLPFTFDQFGDWYDTYRARFLEPALTAGVQALNQLLDRELSERDGVRIEVRPGRVKSKTRTWQKLNAKYGDAVQTPADTPRVVDDLVGLRVVCTNSSDQQRLIELLADLDTWSEGDKPVLAVHSKESEKDYRSSFKPSGYRAYHIKLCTSVAWATERHVIVCELQVRTLLQASWGELTHEDTYKPGSEPPPLVQTLSRRMADLMATLDDMAQDLRDALESAADAATEPAATSAAADAETTTTPVGAETVSPTALLEASREAAYRFLSERIATLRRPVDLASLAWEMRREFGEGIVNGWLGHGSFKGLLALWG